MNYTRCQGQHYVFVLCIFVVMISIWIWTWYKVYHTDGLWNIWSISHEICAESCFVGCLHITTVKFMMRAGYIMAQILLSLICTLHHPIITIMQNCLKICVMFIRCNMTRVCLRLGLFAHLFMQYMRLYGISLPISFFMITKIFIFHLIIMIKSEKQIIRHCLGLGHEEMVSALRPTMLWFFLILRWFLWWTYP